MRSYFTLALLGVSSMAFAASPHPTAQDADGDGYLAASMDVNGDSVKDAKDIGVKASAYDCDDKHKVVNPGAAEVVADGIDQDCSGQDLVLPVGDAEWKRFVAGEYRGRTPSAKVFVAEYDRIKAAGSRASIDSVAGRFEIVNDEVDAFRDIYIGSSKVLGTDGIREVVTLEEASHFRGGSASGGGSGISTKTATKIAVEIVKKEKEERLTWQTAREGELAGITEAVNAHGVSLDAAAAAIEAEDIARKAADAAEQARAEAAEEEIRTSIAEVAVDADSAVLVANSMASHGPLIEVGLVAGGIFRTPLVQTNEAGELTNDEVRGAALGNGGFNLRAGIDADGYEIAGFGQLTFGGDGEGEGADRALMIGGEALKQLSGSSAHVGGFVAYLHQEDHANVVDASVLDDGLLVGFVANGDFNDGADDAIRISPFFRAGAGWSWYGTKGTAGDDEVIVPGSGCIALIQGGINFGAGALK